VNEIILNKDIIIKIISLYNKVFEKNADTNYWNWRFENNPFGKLIIRYMLNGKELSGMYITHPIKIESKNNINLGLFSMWTVTNPIFKKKRIMTLLANEVYNTVNKKNNFVIGFSNENSQHMFIKKLGFKPLGLMKEMVLDMPIKISRNNSIRCKKISIFEKKISVFYDKHKKIIKKAMIPRTYEYLNWRFTKNPEVKYHCYELLKDNELLGYFVLKNYQDKKCHIVDFLLKDDSTIYDAMIFNTIDFCKQNNLQKITLWTNGLSSFYSHIIKMGFTERNTENTFIIKILNKEKIDELNYLKNWYLTMSDSDVF